MSLPRDNKNLDEVIKELDRFRKRNNNYESHYDEGVNTGIDYAIKVLQIYQLQEAAEQKDLELERLIKHAEQS